MRKEYRAIIHSPAFFTGDEYDANLKIERIELPPLDFRLLAEVPPGVDPRRFIEARRREQREDKARESRRIHARVDLDNRIRKVIEEWRAEGETP